jgi:CBS domain-containing protein
MRNLWITAVAAVLSGACCCYHSCWAFTASSSGAATNKRVFVSTPVSKYPKRLVKDCMTPASLILTLSPSQAVDESMGLLLSRGLSGAPVVDKDQRLVGMVSSFDFVQQEAFGGSLLVSFKFAFAFCIFSWPKHVI